MANPSPQIDSDKNPQTRCSNCQTVFEVSRELLSSSDTRVRCGECLSIFDALAELRSSADLRSEAAAAKKADTRATTHASTLATPEAAALAGLSNDTAALDVTYSDFDLFSEEADLPEIAYFDQTRDTPEFDFDAVELGTDETFSDTLFVHDVTIDADSTRVKPVAGNETPQSQNKASTFAEIDFIADEQPREPLIFNYRDKPAEPTENAAEAAQTASAGSVKQATTSSVKQATTVNANDQIQLESPKKRSGWGFRIAMLVLLSALLGALYLYRERPRLYNMPLLRGAMQTVCGFVGCQVPTPVDIAALAMVKRSVYAHPNAPNSLKVDVSFRNDADVDQRFPVIVMRLSNRLGRTVATREFSPDEYYPNWQAGDTIAVKEQLDVNLEINDPGQSAHSYEFSFREL